ncbi:MAG: SpoIVB peptidase [Ruminiclostridium sp.]|nr:SpoIVB peptidase [Ruminiclostridium sp.]
MKKIPIIIRLLSFSLVAAFISGVAYLNFTLPDKFYIESGSEELNVKHVFELCGEVRKKSGDPDSADLKIMGWLPIKTVDVESIERVSLIPCGTPFGIKMLTDGVIITDFGDVKTAEGFIHSSPAETSGLRIGDVITKINGKTVSSASELSEIISDNNNDKIEIEYVRDEKTNNIFVNGVKDKNNKTTLGLWVRDSAAGIGTMTFYDNNTHFFGGLGHGICDADSGKLLPLQSGEIVPATINSVIKGEKNTPGELCGTLNQTLRTGKIRNNTTSGIFGIADHTADNLTAVPIALKQEIKCGDAYILSTINGQTPQKFSINISSVNMNSTNNKNMIIEITDKELIEATGGIVQGMSGSPIIQNGRLVGAVTHVFVSDPTKGYGIFIENMINNSGIYQ